MPLDNIFQNTKNTSQKSYKKEESSDLPKKIRINKEELKKELRILIECATFGHKHYEKFPEYGIKDSSHLKARMHEIIDLISK